MLQLWFLAFLFLTGPTHADALAVETLYPLGPERVMMVEETPVPVRMADPAVPCSRGDQTERRVPRFAVAAGFVLPSFTARSSRPIASITLKNR